MRRREFISLITSAAAWPFAARGQAGKVYRIGVLEPTPAVQNATNLNALREGLRKLGYVEGQNLVIEYRSADGRAERFPDLASELVRLKVDVVVTRGTPAVQAAQKASGTIPVVMAAMGAPFLVAASLPRPGGNVTGLTTFSQELIGKRIELLKELVPNLSRLALMHNIGNPMGPPEWEEAKSAAGSAALEVILLDVRNKNDLHHAFQRAVQERVDALIVGADGLTQVEQRTIVDSAARNRLPAIHPSRDFVEIGGLLAYAVSYPALS
jgi:putative ABC transport system substrate-binding protein